MCPELTEFEVLAVYMFLVCVGVVFPWKKCGFPSAVCMLEHMPDAVRFQYSPMDGEYRLYGIGTKDMYMPSWVVKAQGLLGREWRCIAWNQDQQYGQGMEQDRRYGLRTWNQDQ